MKIYLVQKVPIFEKLGIRYRKGNNLLFRYITNISAIFSEYIQLL